MPEKETDIPKDILKKRWSKFSIFLFVLTFLFFANFITVLVNNFIASNVTKGILGVSYLEPLNYIFRIPLLSEFILPAFFLVFNLIAYFKCRKHELKGRIFSALGIILSLLVSLSYLALFIAWSKGIDISKII